MLLRAEAHLRFFSTVLLSLSLAVAVQQTGLTMGRVVKAPAERLIHYHQSAE